jgi:hypothetical protein
MGLSATEVMPTSKVINRFIFMHSRSVAACLVAIARPRDFALLPKSRSAIPPSRPRIECVKRRPGRPIGLSRDAANTPLRSDGYRFSIDTDVAFVTAKTLSVRFAPKED